MCSRDCKKFGLACVAGFVVFNVLEFIQHAVLLAPVYRKPGYAAVWNPPDVMKSRQWAMFLAYLILAVAFTKVYAQGYEDDKPPVGQGVRFGLLAGLLVAPLHALLQYMVFPVSLKLALAWTAGGILNCVILGVVTALLFRPAPHTHPA